MSKLVALENLPTGFDLSTVSSQHQSNLLNPHLQDYPDYRAGQAVSIKFSPDATKAAILTSGYNLLYNKDGDIDKNNSTEYLFIYDIREDEAKQEQVIKVPNTFYGLRWHPKEDALFVSGGKDDKIYRYDKDTKGYALTQSISLKHKKVFGKIDPMVADFALSLEGKFLVVANMQHDSVSLIDIKKGLVLDEVYLGLKDTDLEKSGGTFPFGVSVTKENYVYVTSMRDNELIKLEIKDKRLRLIKHIKVGSQPTRLLYVKQTNELFVCESRSDSISVLNTKDDTIKISFNTLAPKRYYKNRENLKGAKPNDMAISSDGTKLYVTNGGTNSIACFSLIRKEKNLKVHFDTLIPTQWYPTAVRTKKDMLYVLNSKSLSGANPKGCRRTVSTDKEIEKECKSSNEYVWQKKNSSLEVIKIPKENEYKANTLLVLKNNKMDKEINKKELELIKFLRQKIKHIIYVVKENRSYDQVLGNLKRANSDPSLTLFPENIAPNHYALARQFITLDNFMASGSCSGDGWAWSTAAHTTDYLEKIMPVLYAYRGMSYDVEGQNRNIPVGLKSLKLRDENNPQTKAQNMKLHTTADVAAPDGPDEEAGTGYLWNAALRKHLFIRNYGFFCNNSRYFLDKKDSNYLIPYQHSYAHSYKQSYPNKEALLNVTDPYFRGFDMRYPDLWRVNEWQREYKKFVTNKKMPNLMMVRLPHDHFGNFSNALAKINTPLRQMADNDYALGLLVETVSKSPYKDSTLIFVTEDDAQNGADHVSAQRTLAYIVGPYVKQDSVISKHYTTVNLLKTMEVILGLDALSINDGSVSPMYKVFDKKQTNWKYKAKVPDILYATDLDLPKNDNKLLNLKGDKPAQYWDNAMKNQNFDSEDKLDVDAFNKALWKGIKNKKYPKTPYNEKVATKVGDVRVATFNTYLNRSAIGKLYKDLKSGTDSQIKNVANIIQQVNPDVILINEFDYNGSANVDLLKSKYLEVAQGENSKGITYPYYFVAESNTGIQSGKDYNGDGKIDGNDAFGYGDFPGQYGMVVLSKYPIDTTHVRTFQKFLWKDMPDHLVPMKDGSPYFSDDVMSTYRLSSKSHWDIPVTINGKVFHILADHPTPPTFDDGDKDGKNSGTDDASIIDWNGLRNHDEIRLWADYVDGNASYLYDDNKTYGGLAANTRFVILGDHNADPDEGDSYKNAIMQLLNNKFINATVTPKGAGETTEGKKNRESDDTANWSMRADYVLPSTYGFDINQCGIYWPQQNDVKHYLVEKNSNGGENSSDHRLVWCDLNITDTNTSNSRF